MTYYGIDLDELSDQVFFTLQDAQDGENPHFARFDHENVDEATERIVGLAKGLVEELIYHATEEGHQIHADDRTEPLVADPAARAPRSVVETK